MYTPALGKSSKKSLNTLHNTFNRQCRKIDQLREELEMLYQKCEETLALCHSKLKPEEKRVAALVSQFILKVKELTQKPKALTKKERQILQRFLEKDVNLVFALLPPDEIHEDIKILYQELNGESFGDAFQRNVSDLREMFKEDGIHDLDLSMLHPNDTMEEMLRKMMESMKAHFDGNNEEQITDLPPPKEKSKKKMLQEQKARDLEALQDKGLNSIYKRLAKALHPDLEQDPKKRAEKDELMKRLTVAYENHDLISLLTLESEWLGSCALETLNEESLKAYNLLLKDQIEDLEQEIAMIVLHPRYLDIHRHIKNFPENPLRGIHEALSECDSIIEEYSLRLNDLSVDDPLKLLKDILANTERQHTDDDFFADLSDLMNELAALEPPKVRKTKRSVKK